MTAFMFDLWRDELLKAMEREAGWMRFGTSKRKMSLVTSPSPATTQIGIGQSVRFSSFNGMPGYPKSVSGFYKESGKTAMSDGKGIEFKLGGKYQFVVTKAFVEDGERFSVRIGTGEGYGEPTLQIAENLTWVEASSAMNKFRDEFDDAFETLVQISTLTPSGAHEES